MPRADIIPIIAEDAARAGVTRRDALRWMAASAALAGTGCSGPPAETIVPYVQMPEQVAPGQPQFYATAFVRGGLAQGVLVESHDGRPTKVEGNPDHPSSQGATDVFAQASILQLWDPDRSQTPRRDGAITTWNECMADLAARRPRWDADGGAGLRILSGSVSSPTLQAQLAQLLRRWPQARWSCHDPLHDEDAAEAARLAFGRPLDVVPKLEHARVVLSLDADVLGQGAGCVAAARGWARAAGGRPRLYVVEPTPSLTGAAAEHRLTLAPAAIEQLLARLAARFGVCATPPAADDPALARWEQACMRALAQQQGSSLVLAGGALSAPARALALALNAKLGNVGRTLELIEPVRAQPLGRRAALAQLVAEMAAGQVDTLLILGANPVYDAPGALNFGAALARVPLSLHCGLYRDETAHACHWHLPAAHDYEQWSDARCHDGTASIVQPLLAPLYGGYSPHTVLAVLADEGPREAHAVVREFWRGLHGGADFDRFWTDALQRGLVDGTASAAQKVAAPPQLPLPPSAPALPGALLLPLFRADPSAGAGEFANSGWLQELPRPLTQLTWDNAAMLSAATAAALGVTTGDVALLSVPGMAAEIEAPVWVLPAHADGCITLPLGYGRRAAGRVGNGVGFDAYQLMAPGAMVRLRPAGRRHAFACTQQHTQMEGRDLVRDVSVPAPPAAAPTSLYPPVRYDSYRWGMSIDLGACIGCGVCTVACQAENNIPVVGKEQVARGRVMHWIRVDRYDSAIGGAVRSVFQPVPCMHCENAPCEEVCPVGATVHDSEGLNVQVYNRCVGTRFCSNNCPYKVRRFNFLQFSRADWPLLREGRNPEVTVRRRGVMEKCSYCLQRITRARLNAEQLERRVRDGEVVTACQAACPTQAIVFGDLSDPNSQVSRAKRSALDYRLLDELNTRPRTSYLARRRDPDPELA